MSTVLEIETLNVTLPVADGTTLPAYVARPISGGNGRGLLVFQEAFGVNHHIRAVTERFAREGYTAIAPALFHRSAPADFEAAYTDFAAVMPHMQALTLEGQSADVEAAYAYLAEGEGFPDGIFAIGYCMGGRVAFLADLLLPVKAAVSYYGGGIAPNPERGQAGLLGRVDELHAPILLVWGGKDTHLPPALTRAIDDALVAADKPHATITFSEADHGFFCDERGGYNPKASTQVWPLTLAWFDSYAG